jgi:energy-converting hydrogenase Eha subunit C
MAKQLYNVSYQGLLTVYPSESGLLDARLGTQQMGGGMVLGGYFDLAPADMANFPGLYPGRYRLVKIDSGATATYIKQGRACGLSIGRSVKDVAITSAGSGQTAGTYTVAGSSGTATIQVVVGSAGTVISATVLNGGSGYGSVPTFTLVTGGSVGTVAARMSVDVNVVTSYDQALSLYDIRGIFLNYATPVGTTMAAALLAGQAYVFIQEQGVATVLCSGTATSTALGALVGTDTSGKDGTMVTAVGSTGTSGSSIGYAIDPPAASSLFRVELELTVRQG